MVTNWPLARKKRNLQARAELMQSIRRFFTAGGYLEVDTPLRIPAPAPETHIDAIASPPWFLHTSPEICMKRMLAAGYDRIFQICHCWREGERGVRHLPEFTLLEWYRNGSDYRDLMADCEVLLPAVAQSVLGRKPVTYRGNTLSLEAPWQRLTVREAFLLYGETPMEEALATDMFDQVMAEKIEPHLGMTTPTFIFDYPAERGALARFKGDDPTVAERFELYMGGVELANAFSELTDSHEQRRRFAEERASRNGEGKPCYPLPEKFLQELGHISSAAGIALGVDRLLMVLLDAERIDDVVPFTPEEL